MTAMAPTKTRARWKPDAQRLAVVDRMLERAQLQLLVRRQQAAAPWSSPLSVTASGPPMPPLIGVAMTARRRSDPARDGLEEQQ